MTGYTTRENNVRDVTVWFGEGGSSRNYKTATFYTQAGEELCPDRPTSAQVNAGRWCMIMNALRMAMKLALKSVNQMEADQNDEQKLEIGRWLHTKDGRKIGNAVIIGTCGGDEVEHFIILTDFGNKATFTATEIEEQFWLGRLQLEIEASLAQSLLKTAEALFKITNTE